MKRLVPVYNPTDKVPKKYLNLRKAIYVTSFKHLYPNILEILVKEYGLKPLEKIVVFWMREISLPHFSRYRLRFRKVYSGRLMNFGKHIKEITQKQRQPE